jgi:hypothetical protein
MDFVLIYRVGTYDFVIFPIMCLHASVNFACFSFYNHSTTQCKMKMTFCVFSAKPIHVKIANIYRSVSYVFFDRLCCPYAMASCL